MRIYHGLDDIETGESAPSPHARVLPLELAFLASHGVSPTRLDHAARKAADWNVSPDAAVLALGYIDERSYYRALASELGLAFLAGKLPLGKHTRYPACVQGGVAPLAPASGLSFVVAPRGPMLRRLLARRGQLAGVAITTPTQLRTAAMRRSARAIAAAAADDLPTREPTLSYRDGPTIGQIAVLAAATGLSAFAVTLSPATFLAAGFAVAGVVFLGAVVLRLAACLEHVPAEASRLLLRMLREHDLPTYTIIVPLYREARVVRRLVAAMKALSYPALGIKRTKGRELP